MIATSAVFCQLPLQKNISSSLAQIQEATLALLEAASELDLIQKSLGKIEFNRELKRCQQNPKDVKEYLELIQEYSECDLEEISALGILTLKKLTRPSMTPVKEALKNLTDITPAKIEHLTKTLVKRERKSKQPRDTIWGEGGKFFNTGDIYDNSQAGVALERMAASEGKTPQTITVEAIELRQAVSSHIKSQFPTADIKLKVSVVEENMSSLKVALQPTLPLISFQGSDFVLLDATKQCVLELDKPMPSPTSQPPYASLEIVEHQRTLQKITQYQASLSMEQSPPLTPLSELSSIELKAVEVLLEASMGHADWNQIKDAIAKINPDRKDKVWFALSLDQRDRARKVFPTHYILLIQAVKKSLIYEWLEDKSGGAIHLRICNTVPGMFDELVSIENLESFLKTLSPRDESASK